MSLKNKIILPVVILGVAFVFSGCGQKDVTTDMKTSKNVSAPEKMEVEENLPEPTGDVDAAVSAALEGVAAEEAQISEEEKDATSSVDDSEELNNFYESYDENEF